MIPEDRLKKIVVDLIGEAMCDISYFSIGEIMTEYEDFDGMRDDELSEYRDKLDELLYAARVTVTWE